ncbi:hypothetical protein LSCM1_03741 [Leishmania martiniquensis]|uniref:Uncharacterized protein n=1 Tax=Leishmania martiniquensis TaxID=1580590 RepID=A0A836KGX3_9TRYP|nr:hypothetical protein LSCM1_03741 [Leishmania martiniquensis]
MVKSADSLRHPAGGETAVPLARRRGESEMTSGESDALPSDRPHLFSGSGTGFLEDILEEEDEDEGGSGGGDRLVLHFDSSSLPTSPPPSASVAEAVMTDDAPLAPANTLAEVPTHAERLPDPVKTTAAPRIAGAVIETSTKMTLKQAETESVEASASSVPRRLLLLRSGSGSAPCSLSTSSSMAAQPAAPLSSVLCSAGGRRVLKVNARNTAKAAAFSAVPAEEAPHTASPAHDAATTTAATKTSSIRANLAAAAPSATLTADSAELGAPESCEGQPFLLSFAYPDWTEKAAPAPAAVKGGRTVAVCLDFATVDAVGTTSSSGAVSAAEHCSRMNVASCGWPRENLSRGVASSDLDAQCNARRASQGYSLVVGDASRQSCCWMCPLVAAVLPGEAGYCHDATCKAPINCCAGEVHAGPLLDVWVRAVSGRQLAVHQTGWRNARDFPQLAAKCTLKGQPHSEEGATLAQDVCGAPVMSSLSYEPSQPLFTAVFTASWLSQLCCVFTPCSIAVPQYLHPHARGVRNPRPARRAIWTSSCSSSLVWVATQVTQDCIMTHPRFLTNSKSPQPLRSSDRRDSLRYYWLRSDPHQCDALHRHICRVLACWESRSSTPSSASPSRSSSSPYAKSNAAAAFSSLDIIVTKANPTTLSLRGGAVGNASTVLVAAETLDTAALEAECAEEGLSVANATPPAAAAGVRRLSPSALRARVAITAAVLQHLMWGLVKWSDTGCKDEVPRTTDVERGTESDPERGASTAPSPPPREQDLTLSEAMTLRLVCAARALAMHWVCGSPSLLRNAPTSLMNFLAEERLLLSSVLSVGRLLKEALVSVPKPAAAWGSAKSPSTTRLYALFRFKTPYASASLAALAWLSRHAADTQLLREDGLVSLRLHEAERLLLRSASAFQETPQYSKPAMHRWSSGECSPVGLCSQGEEPYLRSSRGDGATVAALLAPQALLRGKVNVRIEHVAVMNAFIVHLEWTTMGSTAVCDAPLLALSQEGQANIELPFLLLVFVVADDAGGAAQDSTGSSPSSDDDSLTRTHSVRGCTVRLYQVTPFSWHLSAAACAASGFTARTSQLLMHALDLVARRPDIFEEFHVQTVTGLGIDETASKTGSARTRGMAKRSHGRQCGPAGDPVTAASRKHEVRAEATPASSARAPFRAGKRRRACASDDDANDDGSVTSGRGDDGSGDAKAPGDDDDTLVLRIGSSRGCRAVSAAAPSPGSAPGRRQRPHGGSHDGADGTSLSFVDTVRVVPIAVFRPDAAAPLLEVEVSQASQLAAQLAGFSRRAANSSPCNNEEDDGVQEEVSRVLYALLDHWIGFSALHAAAPRYIEDLRARRRQGSVEQATQRGGMSAQTGALADVCVLHAYAAMLRNLWRELTGRSPSSSLSRITSPLMSSPLTRYMPVHMLRAHLLDPACVARAINVAIAEYARQDVECRRRLLFLERDAAAQWDLEEADEDDMREGGAGSAAGVRRRRPPKQTQQRHRQRLQAEMAIEAAVHDTWASLATQAATLATVFYAEVLGASPPMPLPLQSGGQHRAEARSAPLCGTTEGGVLPWGAPNPRDILAAEKSAAFQSSLRDLLQSMKTEEEGQPSPGHGATAAPAVMPPMRLQLTSEYTAKPTSLRKLSSSSTLPQRRASDTGDAVDLDLTVAEMAKACVAQLSRAPWHPCLRFDGATSASVWRGKKRVDKVAPWSAADDDAAAHLPVQLLRVSDAPLLPRDKGISPTLAHRCVTAAKLTLPLAQLMCADSVLW